jgi:hypothetical protein
MGFLIALFARWGLSATASRVLGYVVPGVLALAIVAALWAYFDRTERADDADNQTIGAAKERARTLDATFKQVEKANEAAETVRRDPARARADCLRDARNPADC